MKILVTGGAGYIGSHTVVELIEAGHEAVIVDNLCNSSVVALERIEKITGRKPIFFELDVCNTQELKKIFKKYRFDAVIHFAALKAVGESLKKPLEYYKNNLESLLSILTCAQDTAVAQVIFSSSATVYGTPESVPLTENSRVGVGITNPYGHTKMMSEQILTDFARANQNTRVTLLRYFNPAGAHSSGLIGEDPNDIPNNLLPYVGQVAVGKLEKLKVFGNDYKTVDGTGVRDYIHVVDLARGHLAALYHQPKVGTTDVYNLGTGNGYSVLQLISAFEEASGKKIPYEFVSRREGDVAECYADCTKANRELNWTAQLSLSQMCQDAWRWQSENPSGYKNQ